MALYYTKYLCYSRFTGAIKNTLGQILISRTTTHDHANTLCGKREYVGYGVNGSPMYFDSVLYPMPSIRFRESNDEICALREKEKDDWKNLTIEEKKTLYRYSFRQTFAEIKAPTGEWKAHVGIALWFTAFGIVLSGLHSLCTSDLPDTFDEDRRQAQLKRLIALEMNPVTGLASKWDYEADDWK